GAGSYPGSDFAISSLMMVTLAWLLPFLLDRWLRPSTERTVLRALRGGLSLGLERVGQRLSAALAEAIGEATGYRTAADHLVKQIAGLLVRPVRSDRPEIARFVADRPAASGMPNE
ncbi:MAG: hypothetical protein JXO22_04830, partial [Phycisphaerae bacterium]|nr:hypothetical protein [Phycisphaerae bacterium]